ncbi:MAG: TIGR00266 family protein [Thermoplasmata archaeon]|nr:TIGR00266 family protein [Thermoplasmata archaeon]
MSKCPICSNPLSYVEQYKQWYCHTCKAYKVPAAAPAQTHAPYQQQPAHQPYHQPGYQAQPQYSQPPAQQQAYAQPQPQPAYQPQYQPGIAGGDLVCRIEHSPSFSVLIFSLKAGQSVLTEKGAMMYMHNTIDIATHGRQGGIMKGLVTSALGGESFFVNTYTATRGPGELALVGPTMGDIRAIDVTMQPMILQSGAFLASHPTVGLDTKWQGLKGFLSERDFVMLRASGQGKVWVSSFGAIIERDLHPGEVLSVDTGHLVAFPDTMQFSVRRVGNWKSTILSGEGLVTDLVGPGKVLLQTRTIGAFAASLIPYLPQK